MKLKLLDINEVTLETKDKLCKENISLVVDNTNIIPENIKKDVSILGVNGTLQGGGGGGSGGGPETCRVKLSSFLIASTNEYTIHYINSSQQNTQTTFSGIDIATGGVEIFCVKNSYIIIEGADMGGTLSGSCTEIFFSMGRIVVFVSGNCSVEINT